ncbi:hypothetical protein F8178_16105 [Haloechinothrix sp. LS1_15]|nr:hypothetical protein [Haloechinothrix sp. LS1_15]
MVVTGSVALAVVAAAVLVVLIFRVYRELRVCRTTWSYVRDSVVDRLGMLRARLAAVRVGFAQRFGRRSRTAR